MIIFSIETSCDDTSIAIIKTKGKKYPSFEILANIISSQVNDHNKFGGIVPNLAARLHLENINYCIDSALKQAKIKPKQIDLITVTYGPGLIPALLMGTTVAKTLSYLWNKPIIGVNHIEGHIYSNFINIKEKNLFPILNLVVSGGHTSLILMKNHLKYQIIGETRDDAIGESFDKVARLLDLGYPGGPIIEKLAINYKGKLIDLPRPMKYSKDFDFSFSGLKTAVLYTVKKTKKINSNFKKQLSASFQKAAFDVVIYKTLKAAKKYNIKTLTLGGGVSANKALVFDFEQAIKKEDLNLQFLSPNIGLSTDNAVMIAIAGFFRFSQKGANSWQKIEAKSNLKIT
jgi:N6-L-threonylcarbamoyladenine synthase